MYNNFFNLPNLFFFIYRLYMFSCFLCWDVNYCLFLYEHISDFQDNVQPPVVATGLQERSNLYISPSFLSSVADKMNSQLFLFLLQQINLNRNELTEGLGI